jgi:anti-sigma regulatory factor (Ser/Thr protein kinase)
MVLATHEAAANGLQHTRQDTVVRVDADLQDGSVNATVTSHGAWGANHRQLGDGERGRGLMLIAGSVDQFQIRSTAQQTMIEMSKTVVVPR